MPPNSVAGSYQFTSGAKTTQAGMTQLGPMSSGGKVDMGQFGAIEFQTNAAASVYSKGPFTNVSSSAKQHNRKAGSAASKTAGMNFIPAHLKSPETTQRVSHSQAYKVAPAKKRELSTLPIF